MSTPFSPFSLSLFFCLLFVLIRFFFFKKEIEKLLRLPYIKFNATVISLILLKCFMTEAVIICKPVH